MNKINIFLYSKFQNEVPPVPYHSHLEADTNIAKCSNYEALKYSDSPPFGTHGYFTSMQEVLRIHISPNNIAIMDNKIIRREYVD
jgi:hypothetical protein